MNFDQENPVVKLCARGMALEGEAKSAEALALFNEAWHIASDDFEKFTAAHYIARHQGTVAGKLTWDETALRHALKISDESVRQVLPSLYLNIGKCHEDLGNAGAASESYHSAAAYCEHLPDDGYGTMIRQGVQAGIARVTPTA